ncbi:unnamed protein product, partial [Dovyalis caffra]
MHRNEITTYPKPILEYQKLAIKQYVHMAGIRSISKFLRWPAWPTDQLGAPKGAHSQPCTCQLSSSPSPSPSSSPLSKPLSKPLTSTDSLLKSIHLNNTVLLPSHADRKYCTKTVEELVESTQMVLRKPSDPVSTLNLIDTIQRLGISHHFEEEIDTQLERFSDWNSREDLFVTALRFRLLRHNGKPANADVFQKFISREGKLIEFLAEDRWGMLSLHEASYLATKNEEMLLQAMNFTRTSLQQLMPFMNSNSRNYVAQALKLPRHLRMARLEARNYINCYSRESNFNPDLFQLASLDFNMVQQQHNTELTEIISYGSLDDLILFTDAIR